MIKYKIVDTKIYPIKLCLYFGEDVSEIKHLFNEKDRIRFDDNTDGCVFYDISFKTNKSCILIAIRNYDIPLIAHEAVHAANRLFDYIGEDKPSKEAFAYLVEYIVKEIINFYKIKND